MSAVFDKLRSLPSWAKRHRTLAVVSALIVTLGTAGLGFAACKSDDAPRGFELRVAVPTSQAGFSLALYQTLGARMTPGHEVTLISNGAVFDELDKSIRAARSSVHVVMYIWEKGAASDRVVAALVDRARAGIACRIVVDDFGSPDFDEDVRPQLAEAGCEVRTFRPILEGTDELARNHRKIVVVDGNMAFVGGFGIRDEWLGDGVTSESWREASVRLVGPAVQGAQQAMAENWQEAGGAFLPTEAFPRIAPLGAASVAVIGSSASSTSNRAERLMQLVFQAATRRLWIANAYFVPSEAMLSMLERKASEGVDVRLLVPSKEHNDSKASAGMQPLKVGSLIERGVRVLAYQPSMMHAKTIVVDDDLSVVSSINLDPLSSSKLEEIAVVIQDTTFAASLARTFEEDSARSERVER